ncbi:MAG: hypothetical protein N2D54_02690 [Chloroflexota bacterium]
MIAQALANIKNQQIKLEDAILSAKIGFFLSLVPILIQEISGFQVFIWYAMAAYLVSWIAGISSQMVYMGSLS